MTNRLATWTGAGAVLFALLLITSTLAVTVALTTPAGAVAVPRTAVSGAPPVVVYQGEKLDISGVGRTAGGTIGPGSVTFLGIAGNADGAVESGDGDEIATSPTGPPARTTSTTTTDRRSPSHNLA